MQCEKCGKIYDMRTAKLNNWHCQDIVSITTNTHPEKLEGWEGLCQTGHATLCFGKIRPIMSAVKQM